MRKSICPYCLAALLLLLAFAARLGATGPIPPAALQGVEKTEHFDADPGWEGVNNRPDADDARKIEQNFGYSSTAHIGEPAGEIGGLVTPAAEAAYYAQKLPTLTFENNLSASGNLLCSGRKFHLLLGFFNSKTVNEWRTPNTISLRLQGRGDIFYAYVEYATGKWRAGGDSPGGFATIEDPKSGKKRPAGFKIGAVYSWSLNYDPNGAGGNGSISVTIGDQRSVCNLAAGHRADGAVFDHFGILNVLKSADTGGEVWINNVTVNGAVQDLRHDPHWESFRNRRSYTTTEVRPIFDFGYSPTHFAGGLGSGEVGGLVFRGDCRYDEKMACYGDRLAALTLGAPLKASGRVCMLKGVSDSTTLIGFYNARNSMKTSKSQESAVPKDFLGVAIEGPSRDGFYFYPEYRTNGDGQGAARGARPRILPDGSAHAWSVSFLPDEAHGGGQIEVTLDDRTSSLTMPAEDRKSRTNFDRFGIITTWIDGNGQRVYLDDLTYTCRQR